MTIEKLAKHEFFRTQNMEYAFDNLTNVLNRDIFLAYVEYLIKQGKKFVFCLVDVDNFKNINDTYGHLTGDRVLECFAKSLNDILGENAVVGRYGGDEFMYVIEDINEYDDVWKVAHVLNVQMKKDVVFPIKDQISFTCGIIRHPIDGTKFEELFEKADKALYRGKTKGRNCFIIYLPEKHAKIDIDKSRLAEKAYVEINEQVYNLIFNDKGDSKTNINKALDYVMSCLNVEHLCIEGKSSMFFSVVHKLSAVKEFNHIPIAHLNQAAGSHGLLYASQRSVVKPLSESLFYNLIEQNINSFVIARIKAFDKNYGYVRCDMCNITRVWQLQEIDVITNLARCIALRLYYDEKQK